jgi:hypothetical protein
VLVFFLAAEVKGTQMTILSTIASLLITTFASADATPACVWGTHVGTGDYIQICGVTNTGPGCYIGTNVSTGNYDQVCGVTAD